MVRICLARSGSKKRPFYYLTVSDKRNPRDGRFIERVGFYNPVARGQEEKCKVNLDRVDYWLSVGGQPSYKVLKLIKDARASSSQTDTAATQETGQALTSEEAIPPSADESEKTPARDTAD